MPAVASWLALLAAETASALALDEEADAHYRHGACSRRARGYATKHLLAYGVRRFPAEPRRIRRGARPARGRASCRPDPAAAHACEAARGDSDRCGGRDAALSPPAFADARRRHACARGGVSRAVSARRAASRARYRSRPIGPCSASRSTRVSCSKPRSRRARPLRRSRSATGCKPTPCSTSSSNACGRDSENDHEIDLARARVPSRFERARARAVARAAERDGRGRSTRRSARSVAPRSRGRRRCRCERRLRDHLGRA